MNNYRDCVNACTHLRKIDVIDKFPFKNDKLFTFTKDLKNWNESTTIKYNNISIGEFQIHNNRNNIKFRYILENLYDFIIKK